MTSRRWTHALATPHLTGGDERPEPACADRIDLVEGIYAGRGAAHFAYPRLMELCEKCPLRAECWADKEWREALKAAAT